MVKPRLFRSMVALVIGVLLLILAGYPWRREPATPSLGAWLAHALPAAGTAQAPDGELPLMRRLLADPRRGALDLERGLHGLAAALPRAGGVARGAAALWVPEAGLSAPDAAPLAHTLPLRALAGLGPRAQEVLRRSAENAARMPPAAQAALADLARAVEVCHAALAAERARLMERGVGGGAIEQALLDFGASPGGEDAGLPLPVAAAERALLCAALVLLADALDRAHVALADTSAWAERMQPLDPGADLPRDAWILSQLDAGILLVCGRGRSVIPLAGVALAVDLGGDDRWHDAIGVVAGAAEPLVRVVLDLDGADRYSAVAGTLARAPRGGVSMIVDVAGCDTYESDASAFAAGAGGAALLLDLAGDDDYRAGTFGLGAGFGGLGVLCDAAGNDLYQAGAMSMGAGLAGGLGLLIDLDGADIYRERHAPTDGRRSLVMGAGAALRDPDAGGIGVLFDRRGDDVYHAVGAGALGFASGRSFGCVWDEAGDDRYSGASESLGAAYGGGIGLLLDRAGDDDYVARSCSMGFGDAALGMFLDEAGTDSLLSVPPARGIGVAAGTGLHVDR